MKLFLIAILLARGLMIESVESGSIKQEPTSQERKVYAEKIEKAIQKNASFMKKEHITYFYGHVAKTGGVSYVKDLVEYFGLVSCSGRRAIELRLPNGSITDSWSVAMRAGICNFVNSENKFDQVIAKYPYNPRILLMVRDPIRHVVSQFNHCQQNLESKLKWNHTDANLSTWIKTAPNFDICHFDPRDLQSTRICNGNWKQCRTIIEHDAFFVSQLENYELGLCALFYKIFHFPMPILCHGIYPRNISFAHNTHGTHSEQTPLDDDIIAQIRALTPLDHALNIIAETRFHAEIADLRRAFFLYSSLSFGR